MRVALALACVVALFAAPPADAARHVVAHIDPARTGDVVLTAGGAAYITRTPSPARALELRLATPSGDSLLRLLGTVPPPPSDNEDDDAPRVPFLDVRVDASADRIGVWTVHGVSHKADADYYGGTFDWGPVGNAFQPVAGACNFELASDYAFAVDGNRIAFESRCDDNRQLSVIDSSGRVAATAAVGGGSPVGLRLAGHYLAWLRYGDQTRFGTIVVHDLETGQDVYTVPGANGPFDLQDDGKLVRVSTIDAAGDVVGSEADGCYTIAWFQPSEPAVAHSIPGCIAGTAKIVGNRVGFISRSADNFGTAVIATLDGNVHTVSSSVDPTHFDFDGMQITYAARTCTGTYDLYLDDATGVPTDNAGPCRVVIDGAPLKDGHLKPAISCTDGCVGRLKLTRKRHGGFEAVTDAIPFELVNTKSRHVLIRTKKKVVPRGKKSVRLYIQADVSDRSGEPATYRRAVTVRRR